MWKSILNANTPDRLWIFCDGSTGMETSNRQTKPPKVNDSAALHHLRKRYAAQSRCAAGAIARTEDGTILDWAWQTLKPLSNNEAEYAALLLALRMAQRLRAFEAICVLDSAVVVGQMDGRFAVNSPRLRQWHWQACEAARAVPKVGYCLIPREWNRLADGLATQASIPWPLLLTGLKQQRDRLAIYKDTD